MANSTNEAETIFLNALEIDSPGVRQAYINAECRGNHQMRSEVQDLLQRAGRLGHFLETDDGLPIEWKNDLEPQFTAIVGSQIGPYTLREQIGEGGMGVVYVAEQTKPVKRKVALKIIKPGMDSNSVVARFEVERQSLAMMDHRNVATVFDGGTTQDGRPYFVMELVHGLSITDYCNQHRLNIRERLLLFGEICDAVEHAHRKGIIHRDLKPTNLLVPEIDGRAVPKVIDFGIAKVLGEKLSDVTIYTHLAQLVGTPAYMSPEQAGMGVIDVDTRSDVYSLGVLLYELLTGSTPFDHESLKRAGYDEMRRIIREDEPRRPSTYVTTLSAKLRTTTAQQRSVGPQQLDSTLRGELDWVVMKALEKDRDCRYESAKALASDVDRFLNNEVVIARPPSNWYRLRKFAQRNRTLVASLLMVCSALGMGVILAAAGFLQAREQRDLAQQRLADANNARATAESAFDVLWGMLEGEWGKDTKTEMLTVSEAVTRIEPKLIELLKDQPKAEIQVRKRFAERMRLGGKHGEARKHLLRALDLAQIHFKAPHEEVALIYVRLAHELQEIWTEEPSPWSEPVDVDELGRYARRAIEVYDALNLRKSRTSHAWYCLALSLTDPHERKEAEECFRQEFAIAEELSATDPRLLAYACLDLGDFLSYGDENDVAGAHELYDKACFIIEQLPGDERSLKARALSCRARCCRRHGDFSRAVTEHMSAWDIHRQDEDLKYELRGHFYALELAELLLLSKRPNDAEELLREVTTAADERNLVKSSAEVHFLRGWWRFRKADYRSAKTHFREVLNSVSDIYPELHAMNTHCRFYLAECHRHLHDDDQARADYRRVEQNTRPFFQLKKAPRSALWMFATSIIHGRDAIDRQSLEEAILAIDRTMRNAFAWEIGHLYLIKATAQYKLERVDEAIESLRRGLSAPIPSERNATRKGIPSARLELQRMLDQIEAERSVKQSEPNSTVDGSDSATKPVQRCHVDTIESRDQREPYRLSDSILGLNLPNMWQIGART